MAELKKTLRYYLDFLDSGLATDNPSRDEEVKLMRRRVPTLKKQIAEMEAKLAKLETKKKK